MDFVLAVKAAGILERLMLIRYLLPSIAGPLSVNPDDRWRSRSWVTN
jgi:hypothetical protein